MWFLDLSIYLLDSDVMLNFSKTVLMKKQTHLGYIFAPIKDD